MKIKDFTLKNESIYIEVKNIEFEKKGIYVLKGSNGSGKSTFIETILKKDYIIDFNIQKKQKCISYFSQTLYKYDINVKEYLRMNKAYNLDYYIKYFDVDYLEKNILNISGGEFVISSLIRTLSKDTPIIVLDEPTNNLDNKKTELLCNLLNELAATKTIIVSTHDDRLKLNYHTKYLFGNGIIKKYQREIN